MELQRLPQRQHSLFLPHHGGIDVVCVARCALRVAGLALLVALPLHAPSRKNTLIAFFSSSHCQHASCHFPVTRFTRWAHFAACSSAERRGAGVRRRPLRSLRLPLHLAAALFCRYAGI